MQLAHAVASAARDRARAHGEPREAQLGAKLEAEAEEAKDKTEECKGADSSSSWTLL